MAPLITSPLSAFILITFLSLSARALPSIIYGPLRLPIHAGMHNCWFLASPRP
jgi:hypothetical protein